MRLQKFLASQGAGSRRQIEALIQAQEIRVNGKLAELGQQIQGHERITIRGRLIKTQLPEEPRLLLYHKPLGEICSRFDPEGRETVFSHLPNLSHQRWVMIGRLDINTSGLLLFTNHGDLAHTLMHPRFEVERRYAVRVRGLVTKEVIKQLQKGVVLEDGVSAFSKIKEGGGEGSNRWFYVSLYRGKNREVRRLWESQGLQVSRLIRIGFAGIVLPKSLRVGGHQELKSAEVIALQDKYTAMD